MRMRPAEPTTLNRLGQSPSEVQSILASSNSLPKRIFLDASYTLGSGKTSGIERVVNNLRCGLASQATELGLQSATLMTFDGAFYQVGQRETQRLTNVARAQADILGSLPAIYRKLVVPLIGATRSTRLIKWFIPERGHLGIFKLPHRYWYKRVRRAICRAGTEVKPGAGDLLILPDAYWTRMDVWRAADESRRRGAFVATVVYDLIPLSHPNFVGERRTARFREYMSAVAKHSDLILTISETVRQEVREYLEHTTNSAPSIQRASGGHPDAHQPTKSLLPKIVAFPLGAEISDAAGTLRSEVLSAFGGEQEENPYLTVAAFDPRKNHGYLLDAFEELWKFDPHRKLCLVGRIGSRCEDIVQRIKTHPRLGSQLLVFHDLSDVELQHCYRHCRGVIFPSIVEGFGLPIVEALWHGQRTFASNTAIHREVGGAACVYFDLARPISLAKALISADVTFSGSEKKRAVEALGTPLQWAECVEIFAKQCFTAYTEAESRRPMATTAAPATIVAA